MSEGVSKKNGRSGLLLEWSWKILMGLLIPAVVVAMTWAWNLDNEVTVLRTKLEVAQAAIAKLEGQDDSDLRAALVKTQTALGELRGELRGINAGMGNIQEDIRAILQSR